MANHPARPDVTSVGTRNFAKLVELAERPPRDMSATRQMADAFAALLSEVSPVHREVLSSSMNKAAAAPGRAVQWSFPPGLTGGVHAREKWVSLALLDCLDAISDQLAGGHSLAERRDWSRRLRLYLKGADAYPLIVS